MRIEKIMTREVITVPPDLPLKEVAQLLVANHISGVPVCGPGGEVLGVVSEVDILRKEEGVSPDLPRPIAWLVGKLDGELEKITANTAGEAMTAPAVTVLPTQHASEVARLMVDYGINRVPVVSGDNRLVGIVSRADLVRAFLRSDEEIRCEIREDVLLRTMLFNPAEFDISVDKGNVILRGHVNSQEDAEILEGCVRRVPGVLDVEADLRWSPADSHPVSMRLGGGF